jgi:hypothetical protein
MQAAAIDASVASSEKGLAGTRRYVAYYRMSIGRLEQFALGFDAQRAAVERYIAANPGRLIAELSETVSGRKNARPKLQEALYLSGASDGGFRALGRYGVGRRRKPGKGPDWAQ